MEAVQTTLLPGTVEGALAVIDQAIAEHHPRKVFALFSGGHDSLVATHIAMASGRARAVAHIITGIGSARTLTYVRETCALYGWPLVELGPSKGNTYRDIARLFGMPGPMGHSVCYARLKERALRRLVREAKENRKDRIGLVAGSRRQESARRERNVDAMRRDGASVWVNPIHDWTLADREDYIDAHGLPRSPVVADLHMSGDCFCGAYAHPGEREEIRFFEPAVDAEISACEAIAKDAGKPCVWGWGNDGFSDPLGSKRRMPLCVGCEQRRLAIEALEVAADRAARAAAVREQAREDVRLRPEAVIQYVVAMSGRGTGA